MLSGFFFFEKVLTAIKLEGGGNGNRIFCVFPKDIVFISCCA